MKTRASDVEFRRVTKRYGSVVAANDLSFRIEAGTLVTLLGPSGCGKTTTLRMIAGLELASEGQILIGGRDVTQLPATERDVTMVFQSYALFPHMTVLENVAYGPISEGASQKEAKTRAHAHLELVGLAALGARLPGELSGGQQQRVAVARALALDPEVLLFDEPLSNLDARLRRKMREDIRELQSRLGITAVYVTHDRDEALTVSDRIILMDDAVIVQEGSPQDLYLRPASAFVARFLGEASLVVARAMGGRVEIGGVPITLQHAADLEGDCTVAIRPHAIEIIRDPVAAGLPARLRKASWLGAWVEYTLDTELGELFAIERGLGPMIEPGADVRVTFCAEGIAVLPQR